MTTGSSSTFRMTASSATPGGAGIATPGKGEGWVKIHPQTQTSSIEYSVFLNQATTSPHFPGSGSTSKALQVQDSGVALPSFTAHSSTGSREGRKHSTTVSKLVPPSGQETIEDDDWEVLYPDS